MRILAINKFHYLRGGAERYFFEVNRLLRAAGHEVSVFSMRDARNEPAREAPGFVSRVEFGPGQGLWQQARGAARTLYSWEARSRLARLLDRVRPHVVHLHNIAHHLSPSVVDAVAQARIPMVQTLHDYKLVCPIYVLMREGRPCEECVGRHYEPILRHRCNCGSLPRSAVNYVEMTAHAWLETYRKVDRFLCPSTFQRGVVLRDGWPEAQVAFVPHFVRTKGIAVGAPAGPVGGFLGRLSEEKGLEGLLEALRVAASGLPSGWSFVFAGDGPLRASLEAQARGLPVSFLGRIAGEALEKFWQEVSFTVMPSTWYEVRPIAIHEAFARGRAVIASDLGSMPELVRPGRTGWLAPPGDVAAWAEALGRAYAQPSETVRLGLEARRMVERECSPEGHLAMLEQVYREVRPA